MLDKNILIIGGTGTLGTALIRRLHQRNVNYNISVLSRDEHKHYRLKKEFNDVNFIIGDIKEPSTISDALKNIDTVFHVAALKHIDLLEENPIESIKTNVLGTINVCEVVKDKVENLMFSSTDKAVDPINVYGHCKALSEKLVLHYNKTSMTNFSVFRWGNIINSTGSALPFFIDKIKNGEFIPLTHPNMTRFFLPIDKAIDFVLDNYKKKSNEVWVHPEMKAASISRIINIIGEMLNKKPEIRILGLRPGEKIDECLHSKYSGRFMDSKICPQYTDDELKEMIGIML